MIWAFLGANDLMKLLLKQPYSLVVRLQKWAAGLYCSGEKQGVATGQLSTWSRGGPNIRTHPLLDKSKSATADKCIILMDTIFC